MSTMKAKTGHQNARTRAQVDMDSRFESLLSNDQMIPFFLGIDEPELGIL
jgi:hypothetical protein